VGEKVYAEQWRGFVLAHSPWLAPLTLDTMPRGRDALLQFAKPMKVPGGMESERRVAFATALLGAAVAARMLDQQWQLAKRPGEAPVLLKDGKCFEPFARVEAFVGGAMDVTGWQALCREFGLSGSLLPEKIAAQAVTVLATTAQASQQDEARARRRRRSW